MSESPSSAVDMSVAENSVFSSLPLLLLTSSSESDSSPPESGSESEATGSARKLRLSFADKGAITSKKNYVGSKIQRCKDISVGDIIIDALPCGCQKNVPGLGRALELRICV